MRSLIRGSRTCGRISRLPSDAWSRSAYPCSMQGVLRRSGSLRMRGAAMSCLRSGRFRMGEPRGCGADVMVRVGSAKSVGSSLHVQGPRNIPAHAGRDAVRSLCDRPGGSIPVHAGWRSTMTSLMRLALGYPRICRVYIHRSLIVGFSYGTSPQVRCSHGGYVDDAANDMIIPAYAGRKTWLPVPRQRAQEHSRICGMRTRTGLHMTQEIGASPHMWGEIGEADGNPVIFRSIPAYAGQGLRARVRSSPRREYPRICGARGYAQPIDYERAPS